MHVCIYIYIIKINIINIGYLLCKLNLLFWMRLIVINRLIAQLIINACDPGVAGVYL